MFGKRCYCKHFVLSLHKHNWMKTDKQTYFYNHISNVIRELRQGLGFTQEAFAERLGMSRASIVNIEKGRQRPSIHHLYEISQLAKVDFNVFILEYDENKSTKLSSDIENTIDDALKGFGGEDLLKKYIEDLNSID